MNERQKQVFSRLFEALANGDERQAVRLVYEMTEETKLNSILALQIVNNLNLKKIMDTLDDVLKDVQDEGTVIDSVIVLLNGIEAQLKDAQASGDPAKIQAVIDQVNANKAKLASAVVANTPGTGTQTPASGIAAPAGSTPGDANNPHDVVMAPGGPLAAGLDAAQPHVDNGAAVIKGNTTTDPQTGNVVAKDASSDKPAPPSTNALPGNLGDQGSSSAPGNNAAVAPGGTTQPGGQPDVNSPATGNVQTPGT